MPNSTDRLPEKPGDDALRPHSYDGIQEYDKRLPRWWLLTLYGSMVFAVVYWAYYHAYAIGTSPERALETQMVENAQRAARKSGVLNDDILGRFLHEHPHGEHREGDRIHLAKDRYAKRNVDNRIEDQCQGGGERQLVSLGHAGISIEAVGELAIPRKLPRDPPEQPKTEQHAFPIPRES